MIVSFPNMGHCWPAFKTLIETMGVKVVLPDPTNREAVKIGVKQSPEFVCFPFKPTLGDFVSAIKKGADTLVMAIDCGPCRFGFYHAVQERILHDMGYKHIRVIPLDQADLLEFKWVKALFEVTPTKNLLLYTKAVKAVQYFIKKAKFVEDILTAEGLIRCYERNSGDTTRVVNELLIKLDETNKINELRKFKSVITNEFKKIDLDRSIVPLKVALSGEIHITLEPYDNLDIRRKLGKLGVQLYQNLSLYDWVIHKFHINFHRKWLEYLAGPYLKMDIGGEAIWVIGEYIDRARSGFDGFVHAYPFTCMPEITARTIITNKLKNIYDLPIIFFSFDEHAAEQGFRTRIEAFVDLMHIRREQKNKKEQLKEKSKEPTYEIHGGSLYNEIIQYIQTK